MKRLLFAIVFGFGFALTAHAQTACVNPAQKAPFSGNGPGTGGAYPLASGQTLGIVWTPSPTVGCTTYYTTNGIAPTSASPVYTGQTISVSQTTTVLMIAMGSGFSNSQQEGGNWAIIPATTCSPTAPCVGLSWTAPAAGAGTDPVVAYQVYRAVSPSSTFAKISSSNVTGTTFTDSGVALSTTFEYYVVSVDAEGNLSTPSNTVTVSTSAAPTLTTPTVAITLSPASGNVTTLFSASIAVTGSPVPTGTVTLSWTGTGKTTSASLGTATLVSGAATISIPAGTLATGSDTLTATYAPDSTSSSIYNSATATSPVTLNLILNPPTGLTATQTTAAVSQ